MRCFALLPVLLGTLIGAPPALAWTWPVDGPVLRAFSFDGDPYGPGLHRGVDVGGVHGSSVRAPAGGTVSFAGTVPGGGRTVTIRTGDGYAVTLLHLGEVSVRRGALVDEGEPVGALGTSDDPEHPGAYVHLGVRVASDPQGYVDPLGLLPERSSAAGADPEPEPAPGAAEGEPPPEEEGGTALPEPAPAPPPAAAVPLAVEEPVSYQSPLPVDPALAEPALEPSLPVLEPASPPQAIPEAGEPETAASTPPPSPPLAVPDGSEPGTAATAAVAVPSVVRAGRASSSRTAAPVTGGPAKAPGEPPAATEPGRAVMQTSAARSGAPSADNDVRASTTAPVSTATAAAERAPGDAAAPRGATPGETRVGSSAGLAAAIAALLGVVLAARRRHLVRRPAAEQAEPVPQRRNTPARQALDGASARHEPCAPLVTLHDEAGAPEPGRERVGVPERDVGLVPSEDEVVLLEDLDRMSRVRRIHGERAAGNQHTKDLGEHARKVDVDEVLDEVGGNGLVEGLVGERERSDVRELEPERGERPRRRLHRLGLGVEADCPAAERRQIVRHRPACRAEIEHPLARLWAKKIPHCRKPKARPGRLVEVDARHARHERSVVRRRRAADPGEPHGLVTSSRR